MINAAFTRNYILFAVVESHFEEEVLCAIDKQTFHVFYNHISILLQILQVKFQKKSTNTP
jgi:hypothetical protein